MPVPFCHRATRDYLCDNEERLQELYSSLADPEHNLIGRVRLAEFVCGRAVDGPDRFSRTNFWKLDSRHFGMWLAELPEPRVHRGDERVVYRAMY